MSAVQDVAGSGNGGVFPEVESALASARDALSDEIVVRLAGAVADGLELLDRVNRSGIEQALPAIARLVENGDLDRLVQAARSFGAMQDAINDEIVTRLAGVLEGLLTVADRLARSDALPRILALLERPDVQALLPRLVDAVTAARTEAAGEARSPGGLGGLWRILNQSGTQEGLRFMLRAAGHLAAAARDDERKDSQS